MAALEALLLFVVIPIFASGGAIWAGWAAFANLRARADSENPGPQSMGRFIIYPAIVATPVVFGLVLWFLSLPITSTVDSSTPPPGAVLAGLLLLNAGVAFAVVVVLALTAQASIARARMAQFVGADFGRTEPLIVMPEVATIFALTLVFLILRRTQGILYASPIPSAASVDSVVSSLQLFSVGAIALLLGAVLSNQIEDLKGPGFLRALIRGEIGVVMVLLLFVMAFLALGNL